MKKLNTKSGIYILLLVIICSCSNQKQGEIVKDSKGNYYELNGYDALGSERYQLIKIDTTKLKPVGFDD
jgi:hypothetical protein